ncbi:MULTISPECIES: hypothetical protein [unclassified Pseudonocardia]|uniref:hypothetical protein n=1 Tax=unclassified Pseudonocardia TaxID=2619320 RepID=UPI0001FFF277|nr:hypothetical protein [Pseudonocardia sp. Ae707_Ps1]OLM19157.1 hypothetical protein Ae707Ps1_3416c [Pseudonocardia sp. Ae707_Ps1]
MSTFAVDAPRATRPVPPSAVTLSVALWLGAVLAGLAETLVRLGGEVPPTGGEIAARAGIYLVLAVLVVQLRSGRDGIRWTVVAVLGVLGTLSLVVEPAGALLAGGSVGEFLVTASGTELAAAGLRLLHVAEVLAALALLFHPASHAFFRPGAVAPGREAVRPAA